MLKLYQVSGDQKRYWETWEDEQGKQLVHWGALGTRGQTKTVDSSFLRNAHAIIQEEIDGLIRDGFAPLDAEDHAVLMIEYKVDGFGAPAEVEKRHRLEARMNETLGWTGLGACDGGSIGSGTMEVCNVVADFDLAKEVIETDLADTEFSDYTRIYRET